MLKAGNDYRAIPVPILVSEPAVSRRTVGNGKECFPKSGDPAAPVIYREKSRGIVSGVALIDHPKNLVLGAERNRQFGVDDRSCSVIFQASDGSLNPVGRIQIVSINDADEFTARRIEPIVSRQSKITIVDFHDFYGRIVDGLSPYNLLRLVVRAIHDNYEFIRNAFLRRNATHALDRCKRRRREKLLAVEGHDNRDIEHM